MEKNKLTLLVFIFAVFTSCDCFQHVQGIVIDSETQLPIDSVKVMRDAERIIYTDSFGNFEIASVTGGLFACPKISLSFEKEGYNKATKKYKSCCTDNTVVVLEKQVK